MNCNLFTLYMKPRPIFTALVIFLVLLSFLVFFGFSSRRRKEGMYDPVTTGGNCGKDKWLFTLYNM